MSNKGLGRGLDSLLPPKNKKEAELKRIPVDEIEPNPQQPRKNFNPERLAELTESIRKQGVIEPVVVRPPDDGKYLLVAGERRWRAACQAQLDTIPAIVRDLNEKEALTIALVENIQRENLNPIEEARAYRRLLKQQDWNQQQLATAVAKSRSAIANRMRLLDLPVVVKKSIEEGSLSAGHARALLGLKDENDIIDLTKKIKSRGYSVRQTEQAVRKLNKSKEEPKPEKKEKETQPPTHYQHLEAELEESIGAPVEIESKNRRKGHIKIYFNDPDEFEQLRDKLKNVRMD